MHRFRRAIRLLRAWVQDKGWSVIGWWTGLMLVTAFGLLVDMDQFVQRALAKADAELVGRVTITATSAIVLVWLVVALSAAVLLATPSRTAVRAWARLETTSSGLLQYAVEVGGQPHDTRIPAKQLSGELPDGSRLATLAHRNLRIWSLATIGDEDSWVHPCLASTARWTVWCLERNGCFTDAVPMREGLTSKASRRPGATPLLRTALLDSHLPHSHGASHPHAHELGEETECPHCLPVGSRGSRVLGYPSECVHRPLFRVHLCATAMVLHNPRTHPSTTEVAETCSDRFLPPSVKSSFGRGPSPEDALRGRQSEAQSPATEGGRTLKCHPHDATPRPRIFEETVYGHRIRTQERFILDSLDRAVDTADG